MTSWLLVLWPFDLFWPEIWGDLVKISHRKQKTDEREHVILFLNFEQWVVKSSQITNLSICIELDNELTHKWNDTHPSWPLLETLCSKRLFLLLLFFQIILATLCTHSINLQFAILILVSDKLYLKCIIIIESHMSLCLLTYKILKKVWIK